MELLRQGREEEMAELAVSDPRMLRPLMGRLWDPEPRIRSSAAAALGMSALERPSLGLEMVRRLMWALNDESATNGVYGIAALGEIGRHRPGILAPFIPSLVSMAGDDGLRAELLKALAKIAEADGRLLAGYLARLEANLDPSRDEEVAAFRRLVALARGEEDERD